MVLLQLLQLDELLWALRGLLANVENHYEVVRRSKSTPKILPECGVWLYYAKVLHHP